MDDDKKRDLRHAALNEACRHRLAQEDADQIVKNAQKYYEFLLGESGK